MNNLYHTAIAAYSGAVRIAALCSRKPRLMVEGQHHTFDRLRKFRETMAPDGFDVWFHAASLGEFEQARPLIDSLLEKSPHTSILVSFFSPSGYTVRENYNPRVAVVYLPFDSRKNVSQFLDLAKPRTAVFIKYEFWGNFLTELNRRGIDTYIISSIFRPGQIFFRPYGEMFRRMLRQFRHLYVQDNRSRELLASIGITNVTVAGDTRLDRVATIRDKACDIPPIDVFKAADPKAFTLAVGSSWGKDEEVYFPWLRRHPEVRAIIAPHEFDSSRLAHMQSQLGPDSMLYSDFERLYDSSPESAAETSRRLKYLIIDCYGLLSSLYRYADAAYVGGGFGVGIHNINEAAVYGIPVVFGPNHGKFKEASDLIAAGGAICIHNAAEADATLEKLRTDNDFRRKSGEAAGKYISSGLGATRLIMKDIFNIDI